MQGLVIMAGTWDEVEKVRILRDAPPPPEIPDHTHEASECPTCWRDSCDDTHFGPGYPVKPPWVPWWVVHWTLLVPLVPDYAVQCPEAS